LPDKLDFAGTGSGIAFQPGGFQSTIWLSRMLVGLVYQAGGERFKSVGCRCCKHWMGAAAGASFIYGAGAIYLRARGVEGMGFGDVKLMAMVGAFLGLRLTIFTLFSASIVGSLAGLWTVLVVWIKRTAAAHGAAS